MAYFSSNIAAIISTIGKANPATYAAPHQLPYQYQGNYTFFSLKLSHEQFFLLFSTLRICRVIFLQASLQVSLQGNQPNPHQHSHHQGPPDVLPASPHPILRAHLLNRQADLPKYLPINPPVDRLANHRANHRVVLQVNLLVNPLSLPVNLAVVQVGNLPDSQPQNQR